MMYGDFGQCKQLLPLLLLSCEGTTQARCYIVASIPNASNSGVTLHLSSAFSRSIKGPTKNTHRIAYSIPNILDSTTKRSYRASSSIASILYRLSRVPLSAFRQAILHHPMSAIGSTLDVIVSLLMDAVSCVTHVFCALLLVLSSRLLCRRGILLCFLLILRSRFLCRLLV